MFSGFLDFDTTCKIELRDFSEWHKGIKYFGFWAIEVSSLECQEKIKKYQEHFSSRIHSNYLRQPHVTLISSGLLSDDYFSNDLIMKQIQQIKEKNIKPFSLNLSNCNSFSTCPYLTIEDSSFKLDLIRECLNNASEEISPAKYTPHVTLGFYDKAYKTSDIVDVISNFRLPNIEFIINEIVFARYETKHIQGPYEVLHRIKLD